MPMLTIVLRYLPHILGALAVLGLILLINHWRVEAGKVEGLETELKIAKQALKIQSERYIAAKKPTTEANDYDRAKLNNSLNLCLNSLRHSSRCVPVYLPGTANGAKGADKRPASGITSGAIIANNIECQADRDSLNAARVWAKGYEEFTKDAAQ